MITSLLFALASALTGIVIPRSESDERVPASAGAAVDTHELQIPRFARDDIAASSHSDTIRLEVGSIQRMTEVEIPHAAPLMTT